MILDICHRYDTPTNYNCLYSNLILVITVRASNHYGLSVEVSLMSQRCDPHHRHQCWILPSLVLTSIQRSDNDHCHASRRQPDWRGLLEMTSLLIECAACSVSNTRCWQTRVVLAGCRQRLLSFILPAVLLLRLQRLIERRYRLVRTAGVSAISWP